MQHDAHIAELEHTIRDLCETDVGFIEAFGPYHLDVSTTGALGERESASKKQWAAIVSEVEAFVWAEGHIASPDEERDPDHVRVGILR